MRGKRLRTRFPRGVLIWAGLCLLLAIGLLSSLGDLSRLPATQTLLANQTQQRVIVDPVSGAVSGLKTSDAESTAFDVSEPEPATEEPAEEPKDAPPPTITEPEKQPAAAPEKSPEAPASTEEKSAEATPPAPAEHASEPAAAPQPTGALEPLRRHATSAPLKVPPRSHESLVRAPAPEITEQHGKLNLPVRGEKDARPSALYAKSFTRPPEEQAMVAIVITDIGFNDDITRTVLALPGQISVAISPYATDAATQISAMRNKGHEVWAMLPLMSARYPQDDPGPLGLIASLTKSEALERLYRTLAATIGSVGVVLPADEAFSTHTDVWPAVLADITGRGLYVLSSHPTRTLEQLTGDDAQLESLHRADMVLDSTPGAAFIRSKLAGVKDAAVTNKKLVVMLSARPQTLKILEQWLAEKPLGDAAVLAPLSAIYAPDAPPPAPEPPAEEHGGGGH